MQIPAYRRWQIAPALPAETNIALVEYPYPIRQIFIIVAAWMQIWQKDTCVSSLKCMIHSR